jgi:6-phosphogluconate dehydrogenase
MEGERACVAVVGLAVMGENLALNIAGKGFRVAVHNRTLEKVRALHQRAGALSERMVPCYSVEELARSLERPRRIILLVKAGQPVDDMIAQIRPVLEEGDILIDGGNSYFLDTERRARDLAAAGLRFVGMGVSGGEEGALHGPSIMPGGDRRAFEALEPILVRIAAQVDDGPCTTYIGPGGAGHYVKMVHNGIEYGDMQLIGEVYHLLKSALRLEASQLAEIFAEWNRGDLQSYLIEITAAVLRKVDPDTGQPLVDLILDKAGQKGTGKWTSQNALDLGVAVPTLTEAVNARIISAMKDERMTAAGRYEGWGRGRRFTGPAPDDLLKMCRAALYASKVSAYAQGMALLQAASREYHYDLDLAEIARIWKGGCIIRAALLDRISRAFRKLRDLPNLLLDDGFRSELEARDEAWREVVAIAPRAGVPALGLSSALAYFDSYRMARLPANLLQAQRDYFGAHTYERVDKPGNFHTQW